MCQHHQNVNFTPTILVRIHNENFQAILININSSSSGCDKVASSQMGNTTKCSGLLLSMLLGMAKMMIDAVTCFDTNPPVSRMHWVQCFHSTMPVELHAYHDCKHDIYTQSLITLSSVILFQAPGPCPYPYHSLIIISCPGAVCIWEVSISTANKRRYLITLPEVWGYYIIIDKHQPNRLWKTKNV